jgi:hypothetical protein
MTSSTHCVPHNLLYRAGQKIMFTGLLSWRIADFAWELEFEEASQGPGRGIRNGQIKSHPMVDPGCGDP